MEWTVPPTTYVRQGENVTLTWLSDLKQFSFPNHLWTYSKTIQKLEGVSRQMLRISKRTGRFVYSFFQNRDSELILNVTQYGSLARINLTMLNVNASTDTAEYSALLGQEENSEQAPSYTKLIVYGKLHYFMS